jgi:hypothetical protein
MYKPKIILRISNTRVSSGQLLIDDRPERSPPRYSDIFKLPTLDLSAHSSLEAQPLDIIEVRRFYDEYCRQQTLSVQARAQQIKHGLKYRKIISSINALIEDQSSKGEGLLTLKYHADQKEIIDVIEQDYKKSGYTFIRVNCHCFLIGWLPVARYRH